MTGSVASRVSAVAACALAVVPGARAAVIDDPAAGGSSGFGWEEAGSITRIEDLGAGDGVSGEAGTTAWSITLLAAGFLDVTVGNVYNRPPTTFDLLVDGLVVPWTTSLVTPEVVSRDEQGNPIEYIHYFDGSLVDLRLEAGTHLFTLAPSLSNTDGNTGTITFGGVSAVPAPATLVLLLTALGAAATRLRHRVPAPATPR